MIKSFRIHKARKEEEEEKKPSVTSTFSLAGFWTRGTAWRKLLAIFKPFKNLCIPWNKRSAPFSGGHRSRNFFFLNVQNPHHVPQQSVRDDSTSLRPSDGSIIALRLRAAGQVSARSGQQPPSDICCCLLIAHRWGKVQRVQADSWHWAAQDGKVEVRASAFSITPAASAPRGAVWVLWWWREVELQVVGVSLFKWISLLLQEHNSASLPGEVWCIYAFLDLSFSFFFFAIHLNKTVNIRVEVFFGAMKRTAICRNQDTQN